ncbi:3-hydroxyisobutyryl-coenzyme A hydrolase isoform 1 [Auricularia subglabra TFB-10046 SS5]|nr:3-hydroxyisobutyryl-coenzyme A hydrolase isoform 1 [Auricularia subglabra TFB-10046 SS5]
MLANHLATAAGPGPTASATPPSDPPVVFQNDRSTRTFILNRPALNPLDTEMIDLLTAKLKEWDNADLCEMIIGRGNGRAFCAGGNVRAVVADAQDPARRKNAIEFFRKEFQLDFLTATLQKPYITILDGITMGGGAGLCMNAAFRVATEKTLFAMPETKIGYAPDVGASYFLSRLDGEMGTYLALTGNTLSARDVFKFGLATHYIPSRRVPDLLQRLASLEDSTLPTINTTIEEFYQERHNDEPATVIQGDVRAALDRAFSFDTVDEIVAELKNIEATGGVVGEWAKTALYDLHMRSPTSLRVALEAIRRGRNMPGLYQALAMEFWIAAAYCNGASPDFVTGITSKLIEKIRDDVRFDWKPATLDEVDHKTVVDNFFKPSSPYLQDRPTLDLEAPLSSAPPPSFMRFSLPSEHYVESVVRGTNTSSGRHALTAEEVVDTICRTFKDKPGTREKVQEIIQRKCRVLDDPDKFGCLGWKA